MSGIRSGSHIKIYLSAYRACATNCSVIGRCSQIFARFSRMIKEGCLYTVRLGSSGGPLNDQMSHRSDVKGKLVNVSFFHHFVRSSHFSSVPIVLRAPSSAV